jgi:hypothetical protein
VARHRFHVPANRHRGFQKQAELLRGAHSRIIADPRKRGNTSIALEEVKQGLMPSTSVAKERERKADAQKPEAEGL